MGSPQDVTELPTVSVVILNFNGRRFLDQSLQSATSLDYPADRFEVILCDNGSEDGSVEYVRTRYPSVRLVSLDANYGFAEGNNRAAETARFEWVAFLNNDMRFEPSWLRDLLQPLATQPQVACLTSRIVSWDGEEIDFIGGGVNVEGHGFQIDHGQNESPHDRARRVIAPCGGAMAIRRELFLQLGGFDPDYFCFFEDTDLGWRLNLMGHDVWYTPNATVYHLEHATASRFRPHQLRVLYERNALFTLYKCLDDANLALALPASLLLMNERALRMTRVKLYGFRIGDGLALGAEDGAAPSVPGRRIAGPRRSKLASARRVLRREGWRSLARKSARYARHLVAAFLRRPLMPDGYYVPNLAMSHYVAMHEFALHLERLKEKRRDVQACRKRSDDELRMLMADPLRPTWDDPEYQRFHAWLTRASGLAERFGPDR